MQMPRIEIADGPAGRPSAGACRNQQSKAQSALTEPVDAGFIQEELEIAKIVTKQPFPVERARRYLEPGPVVLISSCWRGKTDSMTLGWHTILEFSPSLVACMISSGNYSFELVRQSRECVINLPTTELCDEVVEIGNISGATLDKFTTFGLTPQPAKQVKAPMIGECHANFECRLYDDGMVDAYNLFVFEIVEAHVAPEPAHPETMHYTGDGVFMVAGDIIDRRSLFTKGV